MTSQTWQDVRDSMGQVTFTLGPYFADQLLSKPRHLLFSLSRYKFAARLLPTDTPVEVLELGCAEGIGTLLLAENGHEITGIDFDKNAITYAQQSIHSERIKFLADDFVGKHYGNFKAIVSLDVIEHIAPDQEQRFLDTVVGNLAPDGFCVIGTPNETASPYASTQSQIGHVNLYTAERLSQSLRRYFHNVFMFGMNDEVVHTGFYPMCHYLFALGCGKRA
ncbi:MAG TPA: class I SAM-dependent methyltransferase [Chloroflexota bacterium]|nr:class I SAM-dependent methyltransferase [Chloroflexota bacterium]